MSKTTTTHENYATYAQLHAEQFSRLGETACIQIVHLSVREASAETGLSASTIRELCAARLAVGARRVSGRWELPSPIRLRPCA